MSMSLERFFLALESDFAAVALAAFLSFCKLLNAGPRDAARFSMSEFKLSGSSESSGVVSFQTRAKAPMPMHTPTARSTRLREFKKAGNGCLVDCLTSSAMMRPAIQKIFRSIPSSKNRKTAIGLTQKGQICSIAGRCYSFRKNCWVSGSFDRFSQA